MAQHGGDAGNAPSPSHHKTAKTRGCTCSKYARFFWSCGPPNHHPAKFKTRQLPIGDQPLSPSVSYSGSSLSTYPHEPSIGMPGPTI